MSDTEGVSEPEANQSGGGGTGDEVAAAGPDSERVHRLAVTFADAGAVGHVDDAGAAAGGFGSDEGPDGAPDEEQAESRDWAWVEEWRESGEPPAWAPGITLAVFAALVVGLAVLVLSTGLSDMPWLAVSANVLVAAGLAPALWLSRHLPVLRWIAAGAAAGVLIGWIGALIS